MSEKLRFSVRPGNIDDANDFSNLVVKSGELLAQLWENETQGLMNYLFRFPDNIYGFHHTFFATEHNLIAGFFLGYSSETAVRERSVTQRRMIEYLGWRFGKRFFKLKQINQALADQQDKDFVLSNIAVYPQFRNAGAGRLLIEKAVCQAEKENCVRIILDVLSENETAIRFYKANGFVVKKARPVIYMDGRDYQFLKMVHTID